MKPSELRPEMRPRRIDVFLGLEIRRVPHVGDTVVTLGHCRSSCRKTRVREDEHRDTAWLENAIKRLHRSLQIRGVHEHVIRDDQVEFGVTYCCQLRARIHTEICSGIGPSRNRDHPFGEVNARDQSATFRELDRQVSCTATGIKDPKSTNVSRELPENWV